MIILYDYIIIILYYIIWLYYIIIILHYYYIIIILYYIILLWLTVTIYIIIMGYHFAVEGRVLEFPVANNHRILISRINNDSIRVNVCHNRTISWKMILLNILHILISVRCIQRIGRLSLPNVHPMETRLFMRKLVLYRLDFKWGRVAQASASLAHQGWPRSNNHMIFD